MGRIVLVHGRAKQGERLLLKLRVLVGEFGGARAVT